MTLLLKVAAYGWGASQNHIANVKAIAAGIGRANRPRALGNPRAIKGAASVARIRCCPTRAVNSETEAAHKGETNARTPSVHPAKKNPRMCKGSVLNAIS